MWQIAQRDYRFGKGKHSSLTKATYDAIGDKFRSLWGREAGWAHSVLFTADLKAFSEKVSAKLEVETVKEEGDRIVLRETQVKAEFSTPISVKREWEEDETPLLSTTAVAAKVKRRRKA